MKRVCKDCGKEFTISDSEIKFYKEKNLELPKRCSECRSKNKAKNKQAHKSKNININENNINNNKKLTNTKNEDNVNSNNKNVINTANENNKSSSKTIRNTIIAAIILIASFFGLNINAILDKTAVNDANKSTVEQNYSLSFRNDTLLDEHFKKHGSEFNYKTKEQYVNGAIAVVNNSSSKRKTEAEDGDEIYYDEEKNEIVFLSKDGYIRTYFKPTDGISYYNRQ